ncbi:hypothetical protein JS534_10665 [Bifidobacterium felsineum]|nr:hypothetical protein [Bifidobacterium felsineum]
MMSLAPDLRWTPIINLSTLQVRDLLLRSKVYIDFGNHPGKDRFPREAAMCGACIITGKNGSAAFNDDLPIPSSYKFNNKKEEGKQIITCIKDCLTNYSEKNHDFDSYRVFIKNEERQFNADVAKIFLPLI